MNRFKKLLGASLAAVVLAFIPVFPILAGTPSAPISNGGITPLRYDTGTGGNLTCADIGDYLFSSARINYDKDTGNFDADFPTGISVTVTNGTYVEFNSSFGIGAVIIKGGPAANAYIYDPQRPSDSGLAAPINLNNPNDIPHGLSNITFCWNPEAVVTGQWCSPGYWRQPHHLSAWEATVHSPDDLYTGAVTLSKKALRDGATPNPTLWQVLQSPQWYGGEAFNAVGDLLSEAHPDVNFMEGRVEDSCPL